MTAHHDKLTALIILLAVVAIVGFVGWYTAEPEVIKYQIRQERIERPKFIKV
jgi:hypothetical protein